MPFGPYKDFEECVSKNQDKDDPEAYCAVIERAITGDLKVEGKKMLKISSTEVPLEAKEGDDSTRFVLVAATVGSKCYGSDGTEFTFTEEALSTFAHTWTDGITTLNHELVDNGKIVNAWFEQPLGQVLMEIDLGAPDTIARIEKKEPTGVSIELDLFAANEHNEILAFKGTGIGVIFYPDQPACPMKDGCGILYSKHFKTAEIPEPRLEEINPKEYDVAHFNNAGALVKINDVTIWDDESSDKDLIEQRIIDYVSYQGPGSYLIYPRSPTIKVGDEIPTDLTPEMRVTISVSTLGANSARIEYGGIEIPDPIKETGTDPVVEGNSPTTGSVSNKDFELVSKKLDAANEKITELEAGEVMRKLRDELSAKDSAIEVLRKDIDARDSAAAGKLVEKIQAHDKDFTADDMTLAQIETIHASVTRIIDSVTPTETEAEGAQFIAPEAGKSSKPGLTVGGIQNGRWVSDTGFVPASAKVPHVGSDQ